MKSPSSSQTCSFYIPYGKWLHCLPQITKISPENTLACSLQPVDTCILSP